jgi:hypothetical protein
MNFRFSSWIGQTTTGHGVMIVVPTLLAVASGSISLGAAVPLLLAGVIGLLWPENAAAQSTGKAVAMDVEALIAAYRKGLHQAGTLPEPTGSAPTAPVRGALAAGLASLAISAAAIGGCTSETPAQQQADLATVASDLICVADTTGTIVAAVSAKDKTAVGTAAGIVAAGGTIVSDAACQTAITSGAVALDSATAPATAPAAAPVTAAP